MVYRKQIDDLRASKDKKIDKEIFNLYKKTLRDLKKEIKTFLAEYDIMDSRDRLRYKELGRLQSKIEGIIGKLAGQEQLTIEEFLYNEAQDGFLSVMYELENTLSLGIDFKMIDRKYIEELAHTKIKGKTFSKRLYDNREQLARAIKTELKNDAIRQKGYQHIARRVAEKTEANYKRALTIARTEGHRVQSNATQRGYEEAEELGIVLKKVWLSTLDDRTRESHIALDGQTVGVDEYFTLEGSQALGPGLFGVASLDIDCRCTTITQVDGISPKFRLDNITKKYVPNIPYEDWKKNSLKYNSF